MKASRVALVLLALLCAYGAWSVGQQDRVNEPAVITAWRSDHQDRRRLTAAQHTSFQATRGTTRRQDLLLLLSALAVGALAVAVWPRTARSAGGVVPAVLALGALSLGGWGLFRSVTSQIQRKEAGQWTLSDDAFESFTGPLAPTLASWRKQIPEDEAVILVGVKPFTLNVAAWALYPRPIYMLVQPIPKQYSLVDVGNYVRPTDLAGGHAGRWVVDLSLMASGRQGQTTHQALLKVDE